MQYLGLLLVVHLMGILPATGQDLLINRPGYVKGQLIWPLEQGPRQVTIHQRIVLGGFEGTRDGVDDIRIWS